METLQDSLILARRQLRKTVSSKVPILIGLLQPVLFLVLFGPVLSSELGADMGSGTAWQLFVPGILVMLGLFSAGFVGFDIFADLHSGFQERLRVTRVARSALLLGRLAHDVVVQVFQASAILALSAIFWLRVTVPGVLLALAFVVLITIGCAALSYSLALKLRMEYAYAPLISALTLPIMLLSGILLPMSIAPAWLRAVSVVNPFRHIVDGMRAAFLGHFAASELVAGLAVAAGLAVVALAVAVRSFQKEQP